MGWVTGWTYRKSHIINPSSGAGQNYQKRIVVHFGAGVDSDENVYLDSKCLTDFGDIRFSNNSGAFLLDYWIEKKVDSDYAIFWVKVIDDLSVYDRKIYIYYGKAGVVSVANGDSTFQFFDDFETNLSKWPIKTNASISTDHAYNGTKCLRLDVVSGNSGLVSKGLTEANVAVHVHYYDIESAEVELHNFVISDGAGHSDAIGVFTDIAQYEYMTDASNPIPINSGINRTVDWHEFIIRCHANDLTQPWLGGLRQFLVDGILMPDTTLWYANIFILMSAGNTATGKSYWDSVFITKYINPEPAHGTWGSEENDGIGISTFIAEDIENSISMVPLTLEDVVCSMIQEPRNMENTINSLSGSIHTPAFLSEDVVNLLSGSIHISIQSEDIMNSLTRIKNLTVDDVIALLSLSYHIPLSSENVIRELLATREFEVVLEFPSGVTRKYPVINSCIIQVGGG